MVWLGEISYEIFLMHVVVMAVTMSLLLRWPLFTGSMAGLFVTTVIVTIPLAWMLHRLTRLRRPQDQANPRSAGSSAANARPRCDAASFSSGVSSAAVRDVPSGMNTGS